MANTSLGKQQRNVSESDMVRTTEEGQDEFIVIRNSSGPLENITFSDRSCSQDIGTEHSGQLDPDPSAGSVSSKLIDRPSIVAASFLTFATGKGVWLYGQNLQSEYGFEFMPILTQYSGNFIWPAMVSSLMLLYSKEPKETASDLVKWIYKNKAEASMALTTAYFTIGEMVPGIVPGNTPELLDIPATFLGAAIGYLGVVRPLARLMDFKKKAQEQGAMVKAG